MKNNIQVDNYIAESNEEQAIILSELRNLIFTIFPKVQEDWKWSRPVYLYPKMFCYLQKNKQHINIGFMNIDQITDQEKRLEGTGKTTRHLKIFTLEDIDRDYITQILQEAGGGLNE